MASNMTQAPPATRLERLPNELQQHIYAFAIWKQQTNPALLGTVVNIDLATVRCLKKVSRLVALNLLETLRWWPFSLRKVQAYGEVEVFLAMKAQIQRSKMSREGDPARVLSSEHSASSLAADLQQISLEGKVS